MRFPGPIPPNTRSYTPRRVIAIRCEPKIERTPTGQIATFGEATIIEACKSEKTGQWTEPVKLVFDDAEALWSEITGYTRVHGRTWLVGHTMGTELRIAQAFKWMPRLGWTFNPDPIVSDKTLSMGWHKNDTKKSLLAVDLFSPKYYAVADIFVLPSEYEPWGLVVNEAMASGLPVIATGKVGAARDLIVGGENGYLVPENDPVALASAIDRACESEEHLSLLGEKARSTVRSWNFDSTLAGFHNALSRCFGAKNSPGDDSFHESRSELGTGSDPF